MTRRCSSTALTLALGVLACGLALGASSAHAQARAYTLNQVLTLVEGGLSTEYVLDEVRTACIDFRLDAPTVSRLQSAGARDEMIEALRSVCHRSGVGVSPGGAAVRSLMVPGLGQFSTRRPLLGVLFLGAAAGALTAGALSQDVTQLCAAPASGECPRDQIISETSKSRITLGIGGMAAVGLVAALDAYAAAKRADAHRPVARTEPGRPPVQLDMPTLAQVGADLRLELVRLRF